MGSWVQTCCVSQLPIEYGEECRLIMLAENHWESPSESQFCYATGRYQPVSFPIPVDYFDYGYCEIRDGFENCWELETAINFLEDAMIDPPKNVSIEDITSMDELGDIEFEYIDGALKTSLNFNLIREDIYQILIDGNYLNKIENEVDDVLSGDWFDSNADQIDTETLQKSEEYRLGSILSRVNLSFLRYTILNGELRKISDLDRKIGEVAQLIKNMDNLRKAFRPQNGAGSQNRTSDIHEKLYKRIVELSQEMNENYP